MPAKLLTPAQKEQQRLVQQGQNLSGLKGGGASQAQSFLGTARNPTGNPTAVDANTLRFGQNVFAQGSDDERDIVKQFLGGLSGAQEKSLLGIRGRAASSGLFGGAVEGRVDTARTQFVAQNRTAALPRIADIINRRVALLREATAGFQQSTGAVQTVAGAGLFSRVSGIPGAGQTMTAAALQALEASGLGNVARAGLARAGGAQLVGDQPLSAEEESLAQAARTFFDPLSDPRERGAAAVRESSLIDRRNLSETQRLVVGRAGQLLSRSQTGLGATSTAADQLLSAVQGRLNLATGAAAELQGAVPAFQALAQGGQFRQLAGANTSRFADIFRQLGLA